MVQLASSYKLYVRTLGLYNLSDITPGIIAGLTFGLFGYDNAFVSPLLSLPLFVEKYQGVQDGPAFLVMLYPLPQLPFYFMIY